MGLGKDFFADYALSEENVYLLYNYCLPTEATKNPIQVQLYQKELCGQDSPIITFDYGKILDHFEVVPFMFGQLKAIHDGEKVITPKQGFFDYTGEQWTKNQGAVFALYHLGLALNIMQPFVKIENYSNLYANVSKVPITYPRSHPRFVESFQNALIMSAKLKAQRQSQENKE